MSGGTWSASATAASRRPQPLVHKAAQGPQQLVACRSIHFSPIRRLRRHNKSFCFFFQKEVLFSFLPAWRSSALQPIINRRAKPQAGHRHSSEAR
ncbi:MAG: hypothetical protein WDN04_00770 [Rhodospirillales bacterium]